MKITKQTAVKLFAVVIFCAPLARVSAQQPGAGPQTGPAGQSLKGADLRGKVPVNKDVLKVTLPRPQEAALKNGLRVLLIENHNVPTFNMQLVFRGGGLNDPADKRGRAGMVASLLREGTKTRTSREISEAVDSLGSSLGASSGIASMITTVTTSGLVDNIDRTLDLFADVVRNPKFPADEVEKYKTRLLTQLQFQRSVPGFLAQSQLSRAVYGEHPAAQITPQESAIKSITPDDLAQFHSTYYHPNNAFLAVFGDVTMKELLPKLERAFGDWPKADVPAASQLPAVQSRTKPRVILIDRPGSVQTTLLLGNLGIERTNADYFPLLVMNQILGGGPAARLFMNLREDKGYTYGAYSGFNALKYPGTVTASADVRTDVTEGAMAAFMFELKRIGEEKVPATELDNAKRAIVGSFATNLDFPQSLLSNVVTQQLYDLPADYWDTYPQRVAAVSADDVQRVARKYLNPAGLQIVAVGDASKTRSILEKYATVEVFDAEGKPVAATTKPTN